MVNLEKKVRQSSGTIFRYSLLVAIGITSALPAFAQSGSSPDGTRRNIKDQPTQRWLPLPRDFSNSEPPLKQMRALQELQAMLQGAGKATVSDLSEDQLKKMEETFKNWQDNNAGTEGLPNLSSIPPDWIDSAIRSPQMRKQAHQMLEDYARKRKMPRANPGGNGRPILPPTNLDQGNEANRTLPPQEQRPENRNPGSLDRPEEKPRNRYQPSPRNSNLPNSSERSPFSPPGSFAPRDSTTPRQSGLPSEQNAAPDLKSDQEIENPFDMLPEDREEQAKIPNPRDLLPSDSGSSGSRRNNSADGGLNNLRDLLANERVQDLFGGEGGRSLDKDQLRESLENSGLDEAMRNGAFDNLLENKSFQDAMRSDELKNALKEGDLGGALNSKPMRDLLQDPDMEDTLRRMMQEMGRNGSGNGNRQNTSSRKSSNSPLESSQDFLSGEPARRPSQPQGNSQNPNGSARSNSNRLPTTPNPQQEEAIRRLMDQLARDNNLPTAQDLARSANSGRSSAGSSASPYSAQPFRSDPRSNPGSNPARRNQPTTPRTWDPNRSLANRNDDPNLRPGNRPSNPGRIPSDSGASRRSGDGEPSLEDFRNRLGGSFTNPSAPNRNTPDGMQSEQLEDVNRQMADQFSQAIQGSQQRGESGNARSQDPLAALRQEQMKKFLGEQSRAIAESLRSQGQGGEGNSRTSSGGSSLKDLIGDADPESIKKLVESKGFGNTIQALVDNTLDREKSGPARSKSSGSGSSGKNGSSDSGKSGSGKDDGYSERLQDAIDRLAGKSPKDSSKSNSSSSKPDSRSSSGPGKQSKSAKSDIAKSGGGKDKDSGISGMWSSALKSVQDSPKTAAAKSSASSGGSSSGSGGSSMASAASSAANAVGNLQMPSFDGSFLWTLFIIGLIIAGIIVAAISMRRLANYYDPEQVERRWVQKVLRAGVKTREDVVRAYHNLVLRSSNSVANWWTHRYVAKQLSLEISPQLAVLLQEITNIYEEARYLPPECELDSNQIQCVESAIQQFEAAGA